MATSTATRVQKRGTKPKVQQRTPLNKEQEFLQAKVSEGIDLAEERGQIEELRLSIGDGYERPATARFTVDLDIEDHKRLKVTAAMLGIPQTDIVRKLIRDGVPELPPSLR